MRGALASLLRSAHLRVRCFSSAPEFLQYRRPDVPACLVLDVRLPGVSGFELQRVMRASGQPLPIVFISAYGDIRMAVTAMKEGAVEFLPKPFRDQELIDAAQKALELDRAARRASVDLSTLRSRYKRLTDRERDILRRLAEGNRNKQIAAELGVSEVTVKAHRRRIMEKMAASSFAELILMAGRLR
jgi:FixJ family two-component response regulator